MEIQIKFPQTSNNSIDNSLSNEDLQVALDVREDGIKINLWSPQLTENTSNFKTLKNQSDHQTLNNSQHPKKAPEVFHIISGLDLDGTNSEIGLHDFMEQLSLQYNLHKTTAFIYYLQNILNLDNITINHVYTCYQAMDYDPPQNLRKNLFDAKTSRYGYICVNKGLCTVSEKGRNLIDNILKENTSPTEN